MVELVVIVRSLLLAAKRLIVLSGDDDGFVVEPLLIPFIGGDFEQFGIPLEYWLRPSGDFWDCC